MVIIFTGVVSLHSICSSANNASANNASATFLRFIMLWKKMSIDAMSFFGINSRWAIASKNIISLGSEYKMLGVTTFSIITNMIQPWYSFSCSFRDWFYKICIHQPVSHFCLSSKVKNTIASIFNFCACPVPTVSDRVDRKLGFDSFYFVMCKINNKIVGHIKNYTTVGSICQA